MKLKIRNRFRFVFWSGVGLFHLAYWSHLPSKTLAVIIISISGLLVAMQIEKDEHTGQRNPRW